MRRSLRRSPSFGRQQRGYALLAVSLGLILFTGLVLMWAKADAQRAFNERAAGEGAHAAQFAVGLRGFIAAAQAEPSLIPGGTQTGVNWLKAPTCGGLTTNPASGYLPCHFTGGHYGPSYTTTFTHDAPTNHLLVRTHFTVMETGTGDPRRRGMFAERVVAAAIATQGQPNSGVFFTAFANTPANAMGPPNPIPAGGPGVDNGRVVMLASNAPTNDIFLRTDGTNHMEANLNMGGMSIGNALDGRFSGNLRVDGVAQISDGLTVTTGAADLRGGLITNEAAFTSIGKYATEGIYHAEVYAGSTQYTVPKPECSEAGNSPGIYAVVQGSGTPNSDGGYHGDAIYETRVDVTDNGANWRVRPVMQTLKLNLERQADELVLSRQVNTVPPENMRILVMTRCR